MLRSRKISRSLLLNYGQRLPVVKHVSNFTFASLLLSYLNNPTEFEQDSDDLDEDSMRELENSDVRSRSGHDQRMPLLVGLFDSSASRRSMDASLPLHGVNGTSGDDMDLEEIAAKRTAGGGMVDSIANMANSILGAGESLTSIALDSLTHPL